MEPEAIALPVDSRRAKVAGRAAERIVADIVERGWPVGAVLGSEAELVERYGISQAVFREAVRLVEHRQVARMRRGPGGGLVIDEPGIGAVIGALVLYLMRVDATLDEVFDARIVLEEIVAETAPARLSEHDAEVIRGILSTESKPEVHDQRQLHTYLARATANPVLELFVEALSRVAMFYYTDPAAMVTAAFSESVRAHRHIAAAVLQKKPELARARMRKHLLAEAEWMRAQADSAQTLDPSVALVGPENRKRAESVARDIFADILGARLSPGDFVGSEASLMERHATSRSTVREAIRILEYQHIALMRRGPNGGLFVTPPNAAAITEIAEIYLRRRGVNFDQLAEVRDGVEVAILERVSKRLGPAEAESIRTMLDVEARNGPARAFAEGHDLHAVLASLAGNRTLELVHRVLLRLAAVLFRRAGGRLVDGHPADPPLANVEETHRGIAEALLAGDADGAVRLMRSHLADAASGGTT